MKDIAGRRWVRLILRLLVMYLFKRKRKMKQTDEIILRQQLVRHEGYRQYVYADSLGYWTVGIGRCLHEGKGKGLTREEAEYLLTHDIQDAREELEHLDWYRKLDSVRQCAMVNMAFNLGFDGLLKFKKMIAAAKKKNYGLMAKEIIDSEYRYQVGDRAVEISEQIRTGVFQIS